MVSPVTGDNVANIQTAINQVSAPPLDANVFRGAVLLNPGVYPLSNTITISASGVVLRGSGNVLSSSLALNEQFALQVFEDVGPTYFVQTSNDLQIWSTALTSRPSSFPLTWTSSATGPARYFRVALGP
jgi:hypothetical protein